MIIQDNRTRNLLGALGDPEFVCCNSCGRYDYRSLMYSIGYACYPDSEYTYQCKICHLQECFKYDKKYGKKVMELSKDTVDKAISIGVGL